MLLLAPLQDGARTQAVRDLLERLLRGLMDSKYLKAMK
jgi:hypothetical protein